MAQKKRCPNCGALNPESAEWCNQCHERFPAPEPEAPVTPEPEVPETSEVATATDPTGAQPPAMPGATADKPERTSTSEVKEAGAFRVSEEGISWICSVCDTVNPIEAQICSVCGTTFAQAMQPEKQNAVHGDPNNAALYSLFLPGAGHAYLGLWPQALARAILSIWVVAVVVIALLSKGSGSTLIAVAFGLVAFGLWLVSAHDAYQEARLKPNQVLLQGRTFVYLVFGLLGLLFLMLVTSLFAARG